LRQADAGSPQLDELHARTRRENAARLALAEEEIDNAVIGDLEERLALDYRTHRQVKALLRHARLQRRSKKIYGFRFRAYRPAGEFIAPPIYPTMCSE